MKNLALMFVCVMSAACGSQGQKGDTGATGEQGADGDAGATGATGQTGATGARGAQGANGVQGVAGQQGATGASGAQGQAGADGQDGNNAPGFVWLDSTGAVMRFSNVQENQYGFASAWFQDASGYTWEVLYNVSAQNSNAGMTVVPVTTLSQAPQEANQYYLSTTCAGTAYYDWEAAPGFVAQFINEGGVYYVATTVSYHAMTGEKVAFSSTCTADVQPGTNYQSTMSLQVAPVNSVVQVFKPAVPGVPPYRQVWMD